MIAISHRKGACEPGESSWRAYGFAVTKFGEKEGPKITKTTRKSVPNYRTAACLSLGVHPDEGGGDRRGIRIAGRICENRGKNRQQHLQRRNSSWWRA